MVNQLRDEGTVGFWITDENPAWSTNSSGYHFGPFEVEGAVGRATKRPDGTLEVVVEGPVGQRFEFKEPLPHGGPHKAVMVTVAWSRVDAKLYLNGELVTTLQT